MKKAPDDRRRDPREAACGSPEPSLRTHLITKPRSVRHEGRCACRSGVQTGTQYKKTPPDSWPQNEGGIPPPRRGERAEDLPGSIPAGAGIPPDHRIASNARWKCAPRITRVRRSTPGHCASSGRIASTISRRSRSRWARTSADGIGVVGRYLPRSAGATLPDQDQIGTKNARAQRGVL